MIATRLASPADEFILLEMASVFHEEDGHPLSPGGPEAIRTLLRGSELGQIFVVEANGKIVGYFALCFTMSLEFGGRVVILDDLYLIPSERGKGHGSWIFAEVEKKAKERKAVQIFLEVERHNQAALRFYEKKGVRIRERHMMEKML